MPRTINGEKPRRLLKSAAQSGEKYSYVADGTTRILCRGRLVTSEMKVYHLKPNRTRIEYSSEPLKGVVAGEDGVCSWRCDPKMKKTVVAGCVSSAKCDRPMNLLLENHRIDVYKSADVAGRPAMLLVLQSTSGQVRKRLWIDKSTFVVLRSEEYDTAGRVESASSFRRIEYVDSLSPSLFKRPCNSHGRTQRIETATMTEAELSKIVGFTISKPAYVPVGYKPEGYRVYNCPCGCGHKAAYTRFTNGLNSISVFEYRDCTECGCCKGMSESHESCCVNENDQGKEAIVTVHGRTIIVIGDISRDEAERMANSFK
jgi:outer membrane lipoprotein-sorting protein